jgi:predicted nucleotidyltransferase
LTSINCGSIIYKEGDIRMGSKMSSGRSGRFVLRIDPGLHGALREAARAMGLSLNEYCARKLAAPSPEFAGVGLATAAVQRAAAVLDEGLIAVAAFGSWARTELHDESDVDLLVVAENDTKLSRRLYLAWDEAPIRWRGHRVEPHFVHFPDPGRTLIGLWAEVAIDGIIFFARDLTLPRLLADVRRDIAAGRIVRKVVHGQPYWTEAA